MRKALKILMWSVVGFIGLALTLVAVVAGLGSLGYFNKSSTAPGPEVQSTPMESKPTQSTVRVNGVELEAPHLTDDERVRAQEALSGLKILCKECASMPRSDLAACGDLMRANQPKAEALYAQTAQLPVQLRLTLGVAATHLNIGCSCLESAGDAVSRAEQSLREAEAVVNTSP